MEAAAKKYVQANGGQGGELLGPKFQGNPYQLENHLWYPFARSMSHLRYKSFEQHDRTFDNWFDWFYPKVEIIDYNKHGRNEEEDQNKFD